MPTTDTTEGGRVGCAFRHQSQGQTLRVLMALGAACSTPVGEPTEVPSATESSEPVVVSADDFPPPPSELPPEIEYPRSKRCAGLLEVVQEVHEAPHDVALPEPYELIYETEVEEGKEDVLGEQERWTITVWPRLHEDADELVFTLLHEVAHLYDNACLGTEGRRTWMEGRGLPRPWSTGDPFDSPDEDFADAWAVCQGADPSEWRTSVSEPPTEEECGLIELGRDG